MRRFLIVIAALAALAAVPATATAARGNASPPVVCGNCGGGLGGWTGCTSQREDHSASVWPIASLDHYLIVNYCKQNGWITSISIAVHGCDARGVAQCDAGPAWLTSGGTGWGFANYEAHASWYLLTTPFIANTDTITLSIPVG